MIILLLLLAIFIIILAIVNKKEHMEIPKKKIAFCFIIYDKINNEELWNDFFKNINKDKYNIYVHYKVNKPLKYYEKNKLKVNISNTNWCGPSIVKAQNLLLREAYKDVNNQHFIFISNSCIPIKSFNYIYRNLNYKFSYFYFTKGTIRNTKFEDIQAYKASQWCILNRKHTFLLLKNNHIFNKIFKYFTEVGRGKNNNKNGIIGCPDEYTYITILNYLNLQKEIINTENYSILGTTYRSHTNLYKKFPSSIKTGLPYSYSFICPEELKFLLRSKYLFARKFNDNCKGLENLNKYFD